MKQTVDDATAIVAKKPNYFVWGSLFVVFCILAGMSYQLSETKPVFFREMSVGALVAFSAALLSYAAASFREKITDIEPEVRIVPTSSRSKFLQEALTVSWSVLHSGHWATYIRDHAFIGWAEKATNENKVFNLKLALIDPTHDQAVGSFVAPFYLNIYSCLLRTVGLPRRPLAVSTKIMLLPRYVARLRLWRF
jgi:hypothetical protein